MDEKERKKLLKEIKKNTRKAHEMTSNQAREVLISRGFYTAEGRLRAQYGGK